MLPEDTFVQRHLYGGMAVITLPERMTDLSDFRPVPDHQEAFADASLDQSVIVEVVEHAAVADQECGQFFFQDLATANDAAASQIEGTSILGPQDMPRVPADATKVVVYGMQAATKGRQPRTALNQVHVIICIIRFPDHGSDVMITLNTPMYISPASAAAEHAGTGSKGAHLLAPDLFKRIISSFAILDWSLFG